MRVKAYQGSGHRLARYILHTLLSQDVAVHPLPAPRDWNIPTITLLTQKPVVKALAVVGD